MSFILKHKTKGSYVRLINYLDRPYYHTKHIQGARVFCTNKEVNFSKEKYEKIKVAIFISKKLT